MKNQTMEIYNNGISIQEGMEYTVHFIDMKGTDREGELLFNHWFGDGKGAWRCIEIIDGRIWIL